MPPIEYYPVVDLGPVMKGMVIGALGIFHVFVAQFAIGGGMLLTYLQWLHMRGRCRWPAGSATATSRCWCS